MTRWRFAPAALADDLGEAVVSRALAGCDTRFPVRIAWRAAAYDTDLRHLLSALPV